MKKNKIIKKLNELGWVYVVDEFTHSEYGHRREHFQKLMCDEDMDIFELHFVLIFHYLDPETNREHKCHMQTCKMIGSDNEILPYYNKPHFGFHKTQDGCSLYGDELKLFADLMLCIDEVNGNVD